jgi:polycomb protein EED
MQHDSSAMPSSSQQATMTKSNRRDPTDNKLPTGFKNVGSVKETHGKPLYSVTWSQDLFKDRESGELLQIFATCGSNRVSVYEVCEGRKPAVVLRQGYRDTREDESFYACAFGGRSLGGPSGFSPLRGASENETVIDTRKPSPADKEPPLKKPRAENLVACGEKNAEDMNDLYRSLADSREFDGPQLLCVAGTGAVIKVIDVGRRMLFSTLSSHGDDIYDLRFSPADEWLLLSASKDESLRLWNVKTSTCIAIFAGHEGHRDCVLSVGWHPKGNQFVSGGMDTTVKIWNVGNGTNVHEAIIRSYTVCGARRWDERVDPKENFKVAYDQMPIFSTNKVHTNYVDTVQYVGDIILSKDTDDTVVLWKPITTKIHRSSTTKTQQRLPSEVIALREFVTNKCDIWFIRFATDHYCRMLAVGNTVGEIKVWEIGTNPSKKHFASLILQCCTSAIRMISFNRNAKYMVAVSDDATVWLWEALAKHSTE